MSEIEKMYENAGVEPELFFVGGDIDQKEVIFPAEKQIELIKWLGIKCGMYIVDKYSIGFGKCIGDFCIKENFEEALAESINHLWQDLTEEEKQQVKEILK